MALLLCEASTKVNLHHFRITEQRALVVWEGMEAPQSGLAYTSTTARESLHVSAPRVIKPCFPRPIFRDVQKVKLLIKKETPLKKILSDITHVEVLMCKTYLDFLLPGIIFLMLSFLLLPEFNCQELGNGGGRK